mgnify:CR=1 FL=1
MKHINLLKGKSIGEILRNKGTKKRKLNTNPGNIDNDLYKEQLATENGIKYYIRLDSKDADFNIFRFNILI